MIERGVGHSCQRERPIGLDWRVYRVEKGDVKDFLVRAVWCKEGERWTGVCKGVTKVGVKE
jgi:hypothetical protein